LSTFDHAQSAGHGSYTRNPVQVLNINDNALKIEEKIQETETTSAGRPVALLKYTRSLTASKKVQKSQETDFDNTSLEIRTNNINARQVVRYHLKESGKWANCTTDDQHHQYVRAPDSNMPF